MAISPGNAQRVLREPKGHRLAKKTGVKPVKSGFSNEGIGTAKSHPIAFRFSIDLRKNRYQIEALWLDSKLDGSLRSSIN